MFLIKRKISAYTYHDIIIGVFRAYNDAKKNREVYIEKCKQKDEWGEQGYREVDLEKDITIEDVSKLINKEQTEHLKQLFVVSLFEEGFGQIVRKIDTIYTAIDEAEKYVEEKESKDLEYEPGYYKVETIEINSSRF